MFLDLTNTINIGFSRTLVFHTVHDNKLVWGLLNNSKLDNLDLVSRSQVCQKHKLQVVFLPDMYIYIKKVSICDDQC